MGIILNYFNQYKVNKPKKIITYKSLLEERMINMNDGNL